MCFCSSKVLFLSFAHFSLGNSFGKENKKNVSSLYSFELLLLTTKVQKKSMAKVFSFSSEAFFLPSELFHRLKIQAHKFWSNFKPYFSRETITLFSYLSAIYLLSLLSRIFPLSFNIYKCMKFLSFLFIWIVECDFWASIKLTKLSRKMNPTFFISRWISRGKKEANERGEKTQSEKNHIYLFHIVKESYVIKLKTFLVENGAKGEISCSRTLMA